MDKLTNLIDKLRILDQKYSKLARIKKEARDTTEKLVVSEAMNKLRKKISKCRRELKQLGKMRS